MNQRRRCDPAAVDAGEAKDFLRSFYAENPAPAGDIRSRARDIARSIRRTGTYQHTTEELAWAARVAACCPLHRQVPVADTAHPGPAADLGQ